MRSRRMLGSTKVIIGLLVVFISIFMLFYIFDSLTKLGDNCKVPETRTDVCDRLTGPTQVMVIILLIIAGFIIMVVTTGYILLTA